MYMEYVYWGLGVLVLPASVSGGAAKRSSPEFKRNQQDVLIEGIGCPKHGYHPSVRSQQQRSCPQWHRLCLVWNDPNVRQQCLDETGWAGRVGPNIRLSKPGLPDSRHDWTIADKHAYTWLLEKSRDRDRVAEAFGLSHFPPVSDSDVIELADHYAGNISRVFPHVQRIVIRFEALIRSRWGKKKEGARREMLKNVWSQLPKERRPDLRCLRTHKTEICLSDNSFYYPHMTVDGLVKGNALLHLLNSRCRNEPSTFVQLDLETIQIGRLSRFIEISCRGRRMDLSSEVSSGLYGGIYEDFSREDLEAICSHRAMGLSDGTEVLNVQGAILSFLWGFCRAILHDQNLDAAALSLLPAQPEPGPLSVHVEEVLWASQRPFLMPGTVVDFRSMLRQARAALEQAQEDVWLLRDDPSYFATAMKDHVEHSFGYIKDEQGRYDPLVLDRVKYLDVYLRGMIDQHYTTVFAWEMLIELLEQAAEQEKSFEQSESQFEEDTPAYFEAFMRLRLGFDAVALPHATATLFTNLVTNPKLRHHFIRYGTGRDTGIGPTPASRERLNENPFLWIIWQVFEHLHPDEQCPKIPHDDVLVELHRLVEEDKSLRAHLTPLAMKAIAEAGLRADLRCQLTSLRPRIFAPFHGLGWEQARTEPAAENWVREKYDSPERLRVVLDDNAFPHLSKLADPANRRFDHPAHKKRNKINTCAMQAAERNLDEFWAAFDKAVEEKDAGLMCHIKSWWTSRTHTRTPDRVDEAPTKLSRPQAVLPRIAGQLGSLRLVEDRPQGKTAVLKKAGEKKEKVKTRGVADPSKAQADDQDAGNQETPDRSTTQPKPVFKVSHRTMNVISMLFHRPGDRDHPGELEWKELLYAMAEIGFSATKAYGSAWNFVPTSDPLRSRCSQDIMVHEPHPTRKMSFWKVRQLGQRLAYRHKLDASYFDLK